MELNIEHRPAAHCENGTIAALLRYEGIDLSESMIFGLASGLYFSHIPFVKLSGMPVTSFRTFPGVLFKRVTTMLGIKTKTLRFIRQEKAMQTLDHVLLNEHKPVGCVVGMFYLPYVPKEYRFHFNGHNICIVGKDEQTNMYSVVDTNATQKVSISSADLQRVRFAKGGPYPLMGQMYWIKGQGVKEGVITPELIVKSIRKNCKEMIGQPRWLPWLGVRGIALLAKRIRIWESTMGHREAMLNLAQVIRMLEEIGTGGAGFRFIYGAFLQEAAEITGLEELWNFAERITTIGDYWREFAYKGSRIIKKRKGEEYTFDDLGCLLDNIATLEKQFFTELSTINYKP